MAKKKGLKNKTYQAKRQVARYLDMPEEIVMDISKLTCLGNETITLENHRGIIEYTSEKVRIATAAGEIEINGKEMEVKNILPEALEIEGQITRVEFK